MANINAIAVSAFSPPDSSCTFCSRLPGGCATMSMPLSCSFLLIDQVQARAPAAEQRGERPSKC
jgi:hypothetical protein